LPVRPIQRVMFSDTLLFGLPPGNPAIAAYSALFAGLGTRWMMAGLDYDIDRWIAPALAAGADIRVGLEDAPHGCKRSNVEQVRDAAAAIARSGRTLATAADVRAGLAGGPAPA
jgi:3-keto-5-aminohexanoate cleavage enzyme